MPWIQTWPPATSGCRTLGQILCTARNSTCLWRGPWSTPPFWMKKWVFFVKQHVYTQPSKVLTKVVGIGIEEFQLMSNRTGNYSIYDPVMITNMTLEGYQSNLSYQMNMGIYYLFKNNKLRFSNFTLQIVEQALERTLPLQLLLMLLQLVLLPLLSLLNILSCS